MAQIALIDDDATEAVVLEALCSHTGRCDQLTHFMSVDAFIKACKDATFDLVFLDRRLPPFTDFRGSLAALGAAAYRGPIILLTAGEVDPDELGELASQNLIIGPIQKTELVTPQAVRVTLDQALQTQNPGAV